MRLEQRQNSQAAKGRIMNGKGFNNAAKRKS
jgi:hypothetical protein